MLNRAILIGNVGQDPNIANTTDSKEIATFSIATSESWKDKSTGEKKSKSEWHKIVIFSPGLVGVVKNYVKKGSKLYIEGKLQTRMWENKEGAKIYTTEIVLQDFNSKLILLDSKNKSNDSDKGFDEIEKIIDDDKTSF